MTINVDFNETECKDKIERRISACQKVLDAQVLKDSNFYCPEETSMLQKSAINHSVLGSGLLVWQTPYAREQYYTDYTHAHSRNPNACMKWFEAAKASRLQVWEKLVNDEYKRNS